MRRNRPARSARQASNARPARPARRAIIFVALIILLALAVALSCALGARPMSLAEAFHGVFFANPDNVNDLAVQSRIPRTVAGILAGASLALAGTVMQAVARNPLADPGILGLNAGAAFFVVMAISFLGLTSTAGYIWFAFIGAAVAATIVYGISAIGREGATPVKLALSGAAVTAALSSLTVAVLLTKQQALDAFRFWQVGALSGRSWDSIGTVLPFMIVAGILALLSGRSLNVLALGDDLGRGLGQRVGLSRLTSAIVVVVLCGAATALTGPIGFVGLVIPHIVRLFTGPDYRYILAFSALLGPVLLLLSDIVGRLIVLPGELQVGIVTAVIGAPVFIVIVRYRRMVAL